MSDKKKYIFEYEDENGIKSSLSLEAKDKRQAIRKIAKFLKTPDPKDVRIIKLQKP